MQLLFKRQQSSGTTGKALFKLWGKIELSEQEQEVVKRYAFDKAVLIVVDQPTLTRNSFIMGFVTMVVVYFVLLAMRISFGFGYTYELVALLAGGLGAYVYYHQKRETIFVRDLLHGRYFTCASVIDLARKEAWLSTIVGFLRQVMESAKHWDGTETLDVPALPKDEAKQLVVRGL